MTTKKKVYKRVGQNAEYNPSVRAPKAKAGPLDKIKVKQLEPRPWENMPVLTEEFEQQRDFWQRFGTGKQKADKQKAKKY